MFSLKSIGLNLPENSKIKTSDSAIPSVFKIDSCDLEREPLIA